MLDKRPQAERGQPVIAAAAAAMALAVAVGALLAARVLGGPQPFDPAAPPEELSLCRIYGRSAVHASPLPGAPVVAPRPAAFDRIAGSSSGEPGCPFVFEVRLAQDRYAQYTGRGGP